MQYAVVNAKYDDVFITSYDDDGKKHYTQDKIKPSLFIKNPKGKFKTLSGSPLTEKKFETIKEAYAFIKEHKFSDMVYGYERWLHQYISREFKDNQPDLSKLKIQFVDIETTADNQIDLVNFPEQITCLTVYDKKTSEYTTWGIKPYTGTENINYIYCNDEKELLRSYLKFHTSDYPDVVCGWNSLRFDIPYIINRLKKVLPKNEWKKYSPWGIIEELEAKSFFGGELDEDVEKEKYYKIYGIELLDYLDMYKKLPKGQPDNHKLDTIAYLELGETKIAHDEYNTFNEFWQKDWNLFVEYNVKDVEIVTKLDNKLSLIDVYCDMGYSSLCNFTDCFHQTRMWDNTFYNHVYNKGIIIPIQRKLDTKEKVEGAFVKESLTGKYEWIVSYDLASLYPSIMRTLNISPETFTGKKVKPNFSSLVSREYVIEEEHSFAANGALFRNDKMGLLPELLTEMYAQRSDYKKKMLALKKEVEDVNLSDDLKREKKKLIEKYDIKQTTIKLKLNSAYGWLACPYSRFFSKDLAEAITITGQLVTRTIFESVNSYLNRVTKTSRDRILMSDTDSLFVTFEGIVNNKISILKNVKNIERFSKEVIEPLIDKCVQELTEYLNVYENCLSTKLEKIANVGVIAKKKRYMMLVQYNEGVYFTNPKMTVVGMDTVRSTTPSFYRDKLKTAYDIVLNKNNADLIEFINEVREKTELQPIETIAFPKGVNGIQKYMDATKSVPINSRASILYNNLIKKHNLQQKYELIKEGDKIKYIYLTLPNPIFSDVIGFVGTLPKEFKLEKYIDYDTQFEKCFLSPLETICEIVGWKTKVVYTLDDAL